MIYFATSNWLTSQLLKSFYLNTDKQLLNDIFEIKKLFLNWIQMSSQRLLKTRLRINTNNNYFLSIEAYGLNLGGGSQRFFFNRGPCFSNKIPLCFSRGVGGPVELYVMSPTPPNPSGGLPRVRISISFSSSKCHFKVKKTNKADLHCDQTH